MFRKRTRLPLERYAEYLPLSELNPSLSLSEGPTPLVPLKRLSRDLGLTVLAKNETVQPTWSFKDRGTSVAVQKAVSLGFSRIGTVSTGNMAASTAAYGARAGLRTYVLVKEDTGSEKILSAAVHGAHVVAVRGDYGRLFRSSYELGKKYGIFFINSTDPLRIEGYKLESFEIYEQLGRKVPAAVVLPVSAGGHFLGLMKGFLELKAEGKISSLPRLIGVQAEGCAPLAEAFAQKKLTFDPFPRPRTIAQAISNPHPPAGHAVLRWTLLSKGKILAVSDEDMLRAQRRLAEEEGLFCLPDSASAAAALEKFGPLFLKGGQVVVLVLTGTGLKNLHLFDSFPPPAARVDADSLEGVIASLVAS